MCSHPWRSSAASPRSTMVDVAALEAAILTMFVSLWEPRQTLVKFSQLHTQVTSTIDKSVAQTANFFHGTSYIIWHGTWWWRTIRRKLFLICIKSKAFIFIVSYTNTFDQFISCECWWGKCISCRILIYLQGTCTSFYERACAPRSSGGAVSPPPPCVI